MNGSSRMYRQDECFSLVSLVCLGVSRLGGDVLSMGKNARMAFLEGGESLEKGDVTAAVRQLGRAEGHLLRILNDLEVFLMLRGEAVWPGESPEYLSVVSIRLPDFPVGSDCVSDSTRFVLDNRHLYQKWLESPQEGVVANSLLALTGKLLNLLRVRLRTLGQQADAWKRGDGGRYAGVATAPSQPLAGPNEAVVPKCPQCGAFMRLRVAKSGANAGKSFWGCSNYPACNGIRDIGEKLTE